MSNLALTSNGFMDGEIAASRNNDIIQIHAEAYTISDKTGDRIYTPVVALDSHSRELLEEHNLLLKIMIKHLSTMSGILVTEDEIEQGEDDVGD